MLQARIGAFTVTRIEEMLTPGFDPAFLFTEFDPSIYEEEPQLARREFPRCRLGQADVVDAVLARPRRQERNRD